MRMIWSLAAGGALGLAGCAQTPQPQQPQQPMQDAVFICGASILETRFYADEMTLTVDDQTWTLEQTRSASGARFVGSDIEFWNKGPLAYWSADGVDYPTCLLLADDGDFYQAVGQEPGWQLTVSGTHALLITNYGQSEVFFPQVAQQNGLLRAESGEDQLTVQIKEQICHDSMSGMPHPDTVMVTLNQQSLAGCGGDPSALLIGGKWQVVQIDEQTIDPDAGIYLVFDDAGRVYGSGGCNRFHGRYQLTEGLGFGPIAATMMACDESTMHTEQLFLRQLEHTIRHQFTEQGLELIDDEDRVIQATHRESE